MKTVPVVLYTQIDNIFCNTVPEVWLNAGLTELEKPEAEKLNGFLPKKGGKLFTEINNVNYSKQWIQKHLKVRPILY
jgi:hypothetical protein